MPQPQRPGATDATFGPTAPWLASGILLAGLGTVLLGPILPTLAHDWHLTDSDSGLLLAAKFTGSFIGGISVPRRLRLGVLSGTVLSFAGLLAFALAHTLLTGCAALFLLGLGLGQIIASTNILAGHRYTSHTGSALSALNLFFSLGAVLCGLIAAAVIPTYHLHGPILNLAILFLLAGLGGLIRPTGTHPHRPSNPSHHETKAHAETKAHDLLLAPNQLPPANLPTALLLHFSLFLFLYGGLETCLAAWLTTYTLRFSDIRASTGGTNLLAAQSPVVLLFAALALGRVLASAAMRFVSESTVQRVALALAALFIAALTATHHGLLLSADTLLLGLALAPFFPATFALLIHHGPSARQAGLVLAVSGLGAALFPWLMGVLSTASGSLRTAMAVPFALALALFALSLKTPDSRLTTHT